MQIIHEGGRFLRHTNYGKLSITIPWEDDGLPHPVAVALSLVIGRPVVLLRIAKAAESWGGESER